MNDLDPELNQDQLRLLLAIALPYMTDGVWPVWHYVEARLDSQNLNAREIVHSLPRVGSTGLTGLSYGFTSSLPHYLGEEDRVRLTVAAALPLGELRPYFAEPFLRVLQHMISLQGGAVPSPTEVTRVWLDSTELAAAIPSLKPDFIARLPELLDGEPATRIGSGSTRADGVWQKEITRGVLQYRRAIDLEAYVATVCEVVTEHAAQQPQRYGQTTSVRLSPGPARTVPKPELPIDTGDLVCASFGAGMADYDRGTPYLPRLLLWLDAAAEANPGQLIDPWPFGEQEEIEREIVDAILTVLDNRGLVSFPLPDYARDGASCRVDPEGRAEARQLRQARENKGARLQYAHTAIVHWLFKNYGGHRVDLDWFLMSSDSFFHGDALTSDEFITAVQYLTDRKLLATSSDKQGFRLTADGQDCAISGGTVSDYLARPAGSGDTYNINNSQGGVIGGKHQNVTQTNNYGLNLAEVGQLAQVAALARQIHPTLELPEAEATEVLESAQALELEASNPAPDQGRLRRATDRFTSALGSATQASTALTLLIEQGHKAYSAVFGG